MNELESDLPEPDEKLLETIRLFKELTTIDQSWHGTYESNFRRLTPYELDQLHEVLEAAQKAPKAIPKILGLVGNLSTRTTGSQSVDHMVMTRTRITYQPVVQNQLNFSPWITNTICGKPRIELELTHGEPITVLSTQIRGLYIVEPRQLNVRYLVAGTLQNIEDYHHTVYCNYVKSSSSQSHRSLNF